MNNRNLLIFLILCIGLYFVIQYMNEGRDSTFRKDITNLDTGTVDRLWVKQGESPAFEIHKKDGAWQIQSEDRTLPADERALKSVLASLQRVRVEGIVAKKEARWSEYEVDESGATRLKIYSEGDLVNDLYLGSFDFNQQARKATSYVRPSGESTVYKADGMISMAFKQGAEYFYNKTVVDVARDDISAVRYTHGMTSKGMSRMNSQWINSEGARLDSLASAEYLASFSPLKAYNLAETDELDLSSLPGEAHRLEIETQEGEMVEVEAVYHDESEKFLIRSSQHPELVYASDSSGIYKRIFTSFPTALSGEEVRK